MESGVTDVAACHFSEFSFAKPFLNCISNQAIEHKGAREGHATLGANEQRIEHKQ